MYCGKCGKKLSANDKVCSKCGETIVLNNQNNDNKFSISIVVVGLFGIIAAFILFTKGSELTDLQSVSGSSIAEAYYQAMGYGMIAFSLITVMLTIFLTSKMSK